MVVVIFAVRRTGRSGRYRRLFRPQQRLQDKVPGRHRRQQIGFGVESQFDEDLSLDGLETGGIAGRLLLLYRPMLLMLLVARQLTGRAVPPTPETSLTGAFSRCLLPGCVYDDEILDLVSVWHLVASTTGPQKTRNE